MIASEIKRHLCEVILAVQADSGHPPTELTDETIPLTALPGFDSLSAVDAAVRLSVLMDVEVDSIPLLDESGVRRLCIVEIATELTKRYATRSAGPQDPQVSSAAPTLSDTSISLTTAVTT